MAIKDQMQQAQTLIKAEKYEAAIKILKRIDHPTAKQWLTTCQQKLDDRKPESVLKRVPIYAIAFICLVAGLYMGYQVAHWQSSRQSLAEDAEYLRAVTQVCNASGQLTSAQCRDFMDLTLYLYRADLIDCSTLYTDIPGFTASDFYGS